MVLPVTNHLIVMTGVDDDSVGGKRRGSMAS